tara:strand:+ start:145 stop:1425 length:1281 start_codon:yes stop_codon:yes gene_type:complete
MANYTYTVTVASGSLYGGGSGNVYYLDGARNSTGPGTVSWVNGGTLRFEQSDASNDGHPLIFSTTTSRDQYLTSGVTYYLDGASNYANYVNATTFNAATTRYVEVTPSSETDFFYLCYYHGIGMGGIMDITQDTWGAKTWGAGVYGDQSSSAAAVSGLSLTSTLGPLEFAGSANGWGRAEWNSGAWGITGSVLGSGQSLSSSIGSVTIDAKVELGWGRGGWGNRAWGETFSVAATGQQATLSQGTATAKTDVTIVQSGMDLITITQGLSSITIDGNPTVFVGEAALQTSIGGVDSVIGEATVVPTGQSLSSSVGVVVPENKTEVDVTMFAMSLTLGTATLEQSTVETLTTAGLLTNSVGSIIPVSAYDVTGQALTSSVGSVSIVGGANIDVSGIGLTANIGSVNVTPWSEIDPGVNNIWTEVDRAA